MKIQISRPSFSNLIQLFFGLASVAISAGCGSKHVSEPARNVPPTVSAPAEAEPSGPSIDYVALQKSLGLDRENSDLGYSEKGFDTCKVGYGYSGTHYCHHEYFVVLHFRLMCRDSEGTVAEGVNTVDMMSIADRRVKWNLKGISGTLQTDGEGYGQIHTVSPISQKSQRLKLAVGPEFLYMRANEITKVVTPKPWCDSH
jgi:hypothetical protein